MSEKRPMPDWTDPEALLKHVQGIKPEQQLKLIETERKPRLGEAEKRYYQTIAEIKEWQEKEKERIRKEAEGE